MSMKKTKSILPLMEIIAIATTIKDSELFNDSKDKIKSIIERQKQSLSEREENNPSGHKEGSIVEKFDLYLSKSEPNTVTYVISALGHNKEKIDISFSSDKKNLIIKSGKPYNKLLINNEIIHQSLEVKEIDVSIPLEQEVESTHINPVMSNGLLSITIKYPNLNTKSSESIPIN